VNSFFLGQIFKCGNLTFQFVPAMTLCVTPAPPYWFAQAASGAPPAEEAKPAASAPAEEAKAAEPVVPPAAEEAKPNAEAPAEEAMVKAKAKAKGKARAKAKPNAEALAEEAAPMPMPEDSNASNTTQQRHP
jgi:hypothetical protein